MNQQKITFLGQTDLACEGRPENFVLRAAKGAGEGGREKAGGGSRSRWGKGGRRLDADQSRGRSGWGRGGADQRRERVGTDGGRRKQVGSRRRWAQTAGTEADGAVLEEFLTKLYPAHYN